MPEQAGAWASLGLTYKPGLRRLSKSQRAICSRNAQLVARGVSVLACDPAGNANAARGLNGSIALTNSATECIQQSDVLALTTPWAQFAEIPAETWARPANPRVVIDCWRSLGFLRDIPGIVYVALGTGEAAPPAEYERRLGQRVSGAR